ncbi:hypothetical protein Tco_1071495, partial [Tanacetum coccineum]
MKESIALINAPLYTQLKSIIIYRKYQIVNVLRDAAEATEVDEPATTPTISSEAVELVVDLGMWVMRSKEIEIGLLEDVVLGTIKSTSYEHFVADADMEETGEKKETVFKL